MTNGSLLELPASLTSLGLIPESGINVSEFTNEWEFPCPACHHPRHLHVNLDKGVYVCVTPGCSVRGHTGGVVAPPKTPTVDWKTMSTVYSRLIEVSKLSDRHRKWFNGRGILLEDQHEYGLQARSTTFAAHHLTKDFPRSLLVETGIISPKASTNGWLAHDRVIIPYFRPMIKKICYARSRSTYSSEGFKYLSPAGVPSRDVSWGWERVAPETPILVVTEGELKAQASWQAGVPCVALPGMMAGHDTLAKLCAKFKIGKVIILFDTERAVTYDGIPKQEIVEVAAHRLENKLSKLEIRTSIKWLPDGAGMKQDIDAFILENGAEKYKELVYDCCV